MKKLLRDNRTLFLLATTLYLVLASSLPVTLYFQNVHDDALYWSQGLSISEGNWLGKYDNKTLLRGPGFAIFLAWSKTLGLPANVSLAALHALSSYLLFLVLRRTQLRPALQYILPGAFLFIPALFPMRIIRDFFYGSMLSLIFIFAALAYANRNKVLRRNVALGLGSLCGSLAWLTRDESIFLVPALALLFFPILLNWGQKRLGSKESFISAGVVIAIFALPFATIVAANFESFGRPVISERNSAAFSNVMSRLYSINTVNQVPYVPVPDKTLEDLFDKSSKLAELQPYLSGEGTGWQMFGCAIYPSTCGQYVAGWFEFAFRDAVQEAGRYESANSSDKFYSDLGRELDDLCASKELVCSSKGYSLVPWLSNSQKAQIPSSFARAAIKVTGASPGADQFGPTQLGGYDPAAFKNFLGNPPLADATSLQGWFVSETDEWLILRCPTYTEQVARQPSPDLVDGLKLDNVANSRFSLTNREFENCALATDSGEELFQLALENRKPFSVSAPNHTLNFDTYSLQVRQESKLSKSYWLGLNNFYGLFGPVFISIGLLFFLGASLSVVRRRLKVSMFLVIAAASWMVGGARLLMLAIIDVSMFPAIQDVYLQPAYVSIWLAAVFSIAAFYSKNIRSQGLDSK